MTTETTAGTAGYTAALEGAAYTDEGAAGRIFMRGDDRAALLHRLSTNDIERLRPGQGARTVLTTPIGRIIDLVAVHALEDALLLITSPDQGPAVFGLLKRNIFFNDKVTLEPAGRSHGLLALYGPAAADLLGRLGAPGLGALAPHHSAQAEVAGVRLIAAARPPIGGPSFTLAAPAEGLEQVRAALAGVGAAPLAPGELDVLRVERGYPAFGRELSQEYIPLETGLLDAVSFSKGCYVGQEIIARMESRGRLAKRLVGLRLSRPLQSPPAGAPLKLSVEGKEAGDLTSAALSPRLGPVALAYVRSAHAEAGARVRIGPDGPEAEVAELPFA